MSKVESFHTYLNATKDMAQSVIHRYDTCDEEPNVRWEIIEDVFDGLIAVYLDMFYDKNGEPLDKDWATIGGVKVPTMKISPYLTEKDVADDIDSTNERIDEIMQSLNDLALIVGDRGKDIEQIEMRLKIIEEWREERRCSSD